MRVSAIKNQNTNFGAQVKVGYPYKDLLSFAPLKGMHEQLKKSGTENVYEIGKTVYSQNSKLGKNELLLNGEKFAEQRINPADGAFGFMKKFLQKCLDKETTIMAETPVVSEKLDKIRALIKDMGLSVENVKKWL